MDFFEACTVLLRRWYITVPCLVLAFAGTYLAYTSAATQYEAKGSLVLELPSARDTAKGLEVCPTNPWCTNGDLLSIGNVTSLSMADPKITKAILAGHEGATFDVALSNDNRSSIINYQVTGTSAEDTLATLTDVRKGIEDTLQARQTTRNPVSQQPVDPADLVTASEVSIDAQASPQTGSKSRSAAAALALGLAATIGAVFLFESIATSRKAKTSLLDRIAEGMEPPASKATTTTREPPTVRDASPPVETPPEPSRYTGSRT